MYILDQSPILNWLMHVRLYLSKAVHIDTGRLLTGDALNWSALRNWVLFDLLGNYLELRIYSSLYINKEMCYMFFFLNHFFTFFYYDFFFCFTYRTFPLRRVTWKMFKAFVPTTKGMENLHLVTRKLK